MSEASMQPTGVAALRQYVVGKLIHGTLAGISSGARFFHPKAQPWRRGVEVARDIPYREPGAQAEAHLLDIYRPVERQGKLPVLFYVHGGGFRILSKDSHWMFGCGYAQRGWLVVSINYTLSGTEPFPAAVKDTFAAWLWMLEHIEEYGGDLSRIAVGGESAGANLIMDVVLAACWKRPEPWARRVFEAGVVPDVALPACGFHQVSQGERYLKNTTIPLWMRDRIAQICRSYLPDASGDPDRYRLADPLLWFEEAEPPARPLPATFVTCGDQDPVLEDSVRMGKALQRFDSPTETVIYPGGIHAFHAFIWNELAKKQWADTDAFLEKHVELG